MRYTLFVFGLLSALCLSSCGITKKITDAVPNTISRWSIVHKQTIQQGSVLTQEALDELSPGMSKDEVRFTLGTPSLVDVFHQERWDYLYWIQVPGEELVQKSLSIYFTDDLVDHIEGDYEPDERTENFNERVVLEVPDYQGEGFLKRTYNKISGQETE